MELKIEGMTCGGCAKSVIMAIQSVDSAAIVHTNPAIREVKVETTASSESVLKVLEEAGYPATLN
jgi:copper chaperone